MAKKSLSYEEALAKLEESVSALEQDNLTLENALSHFEEGISYVRQCHEHLKKTDGKLKELLKSDNGEYIEKVIGINLESFLGGDIFNDEA